MQLVLVCMHMSVCAYGCVGVWVCVHMRVVFMHMLRMHMERCLRMNME